MTTNRRLGRKRFRAARRKMGRGTRRAGLAPLELVLVLPLLMFATALIINAGTAASWKVRALGTTREAAFRARWPRSNAKPHPASWPSGAIVGNEGTNSLGVLDRDEIDKPVVRGPTVGATDVDEQLLNPARGTYRGHSEIVRQRPLLPVFANMHYDLDHLIVEDTFPYLRTGLSSNVQRRIKVIYDMEEDHLAEWGQYEAAVARTASTLTETNLLPLTYRLPPWGSSSTWYEDPDFYRLRWKYRSSPGNFRRRSPDHHPRLPGFCGLNADSVYKNNVASLIAAIGDDPDKRDPSVPRTLAQSYITLYRGAIAAVAADLAKLKKDAAAASLIAEVQAELDARKAELEPKIAELEKFRDQF